MIEEDNKGSLEPADGKEQSRFQKLLQKLQEESWQLELLISGFAIFLLTQTYEAMQPLTLRISATTSNAVLVFIPVLLYAMISLLIVSLVTHLLFRGLWVGAVGLRYVSGEIEYDELGYGSKFRAFLERKVGTYDNFLQRMEKICSILFAFGFLMAFTVLSLLCYFIFLGMLTWLLDLISINWITIIVMGIFLILSVLYLFDFVTLGALKKLNGFARFYIPVYTFFSWITLSFAYRPLYYNFIDNKFSRVLVWLLIPFFAVLSLFSSSYYQGTPYSPILSFQQNYNPAGDLNVPSCFYDDLRDPKSCAHISQFSIPSRYVESKYLEIFLSYIPQDNQNLKRYCDDYTPRNKEGYKPFGNWAEGMKYGLQLMRKSDDSQQEEIVKAMKCLQSMYSISIDDSVYNDLDLQFYLHPNAGERGLLAVINIKGLDEGRHSLTVSKKIFNPFKRKFEDKDTSIPFWN